jgi:hypothetical protein
VTTVTSVTVDVIVEVGVENPVGQQSNLSLSQPTMGTKYTVGPSSSTNSGAPQYPVKMLPDPAHCEPGI